MSGTLSQAELDLYRTQPQGIELFLSIYKPNTVLACQVNDASIAKGARSITYNTVSSGNYANIVSGQTLWVGSTPGGRDLGKVRVKSATSSVLTVAENSHIRWTNGAYLTVVDVIDIVPIFPRIIADPANAENTIWYKDYDIAYTNQNELMGTFINMGPHRAGDLDDNGECKFWFGSTGTSHVNSEALSYLWDFPGADGITGSTSATPGWVTYKSAQHTQAKLRVTGANGSIDYSYRYVSVYPKNNISKGWTIGNPQGSRSSNGYIFDITIYEPWNYDIYEGAVVVIYNKSWYGYSQTQLGGNSEHNSNIFASGYILQNSIKYDYEKSSVTFKVGSVSEIMKLTMGFAISVENSIGTPTTWYQIKNNNLKRSIYHFLRWHSTVLLTTDFQFLASDRYIQYFDSDRGSIFDAVNSVMQSALLGEIVCDRQGKIWAERSMEVTHSAKSVYTAQFTLIKDDWLNEPVIQEEPYDNLSYIELGGVQFSPIIVGEAASVALLACAPGESPSNHGKVESPTGLALQSQTELNQIVGDVFAYRNAKIPRIELDMRGSFLCLDIAPITVLQVEIAEDDTTEHKTISNPYFIESLNYAYKSDQQLLQTSTTLHEITEGVSGDTLIIPITPPTDFPTYSFPFPKFPIQPLPVPPVLPPTPLGIVAIYVTASGHESLWFTSDLSFSSPLWYNATTPFDWTLEELASICIFDMNRYGRAYLASSPRIKPSLTTTNLYSQLVGGSGRTLVGSDSYIKTYVPVGPFNQSPASIVAIGVDLSRDKTVACWVTEQYPDNKNASFFADASDSLLFKQNNFPGNMVAELAGNLSFYSGKWYLTMAAGLGQTGGIWRLSSDLTSIEYGLLTSAKYHNHAETADIICTANIGNVLSNNGQTVDRTFATSTDRHQGTACDPTGQYMMTYDGSIGKGVVVSSDYGATWSVCSNFPHNLAIVNNSISFLNMGDANTWIVAYNATLNSVLNIQYTPDFGVTWISKIGNLLDWIPYTSGHIGIHYA